MADKRFNNPKVSTKWRENSQRKCNIQEGRINAEKKMIEKYKEKEKYASVVKLVSREVLKRDGIQCTYIRLYPIIKEIIENSKYLSSRYTEADIPAITSGVVKQCHHILSAGKEEDIEIR